MRRCFAGPNIVDHAKSADGSISRRNFNDGSGYRDGKRHDRIVRHRAVRRRRHDSNGGGDLRRVCDGICAARFVDGTRLVRRPGRHSAGLDRDGRGRPQPSVGCAQPQSVGARSELADAAQRHDPALNAFGIDGAEPDPVRHSNRYPYDRRQADDVRSAFDGADAGRGLPLTNLEQRDAQIAAIGGSERAAAPFLGELLQGKG
jgi:hypothetical protein